MAPVVAQLQLFKQLEGQLARTLRERSSTDPAIRELRKQLRAAAESVILKNYEVAQDKGVEMKLWHICFHKPVQEFRQRITDAKTRKEKGKELLSKYQKTFENVLADAISFYKALAYKMQLVYGTVGYEVPEQELELGPQAEELTASEYSVDIRVSIQRCLICLGDLERYRIQLSSRPKKSWSSADQYYCKAITVFPEGGNAFNQRAVLAGYEGREMAAVYNYFRSLGVAIPFSIAKENLNQIFEQVRQGQKALPPAVPGKNNHRAMNGWTLPHLTKTVETRFLHLQGLLFTGINFDEFPKVIQAALCDLDDLLARDAVVKGPVGHGPQRSDVSILQLAAVSIFHASNLPSADNLNEAQLMKWVQQRRSALDLVFVFAGRLMKAVALAASTIEEGVAASPILPAVYVLLQWLATNMDELKDPEEPNAGTRSYLCKGLAEFTVAVTATSEKYRGTKREPVMTEQTAVALPEDLELRAYSPLTKYQEELDYSAPLNDKEAKWPRVDKVSQLLRRIAGSMKAANLASRAGCPAACKAINNFLAKLGSQQMPVTPKPEAVFAEDGDEEEVIVFTPAAEKQVGAPSSVPQQEETIEDGPSRAESPQAARNPSPMAISPDRPPAANKPQDVQIPPARPDSPALDAKQATAKQSASGGLSDAVSDLEHMIRAGGSDPGVTQQPSRANPGKAVLPPLASDQCYDPWSGHSLNSLPPEAQPAEAAAMASTLADRQILADSSLAGPQPHGPHIGQTHGQGNLSAPPTCSAMLKQDSNRGAVAAPPGFPQPGSFVGNQTPSDMGALQAPPPAPATVSQPLARVSGVSAAFSDPWAGLDHNPPPILSDSSHAANVPTGYNSNQNFVLQTAPARENYAGFFPQSPLPSHLPPHLLDGDLHTSRRCSPVGSDAVGMNAQEHPIGAVAGSRSALTSEGIWQGLGNDSNQGSHPNAYPLARRGIHDWSANPPARSHLDPELVRMLQAAPAAPGSGFWDQGTFSHPGTDFGRLQELLAGGSSITGLQQAHGDLPGSSRPQWSDQPNALGLLEGSLVATLGLRNGGPESVHSAAPALPGLQQDDSGNLGLLNHTSGQQLGRFPVSFQSGKAVEMPAWQSNNRAADPMQWSWQSKAGVSGGLEGDPEKRAFSEPLAAGAIRFQEPGQLLWGHGLDDKQPGAGALGEQNPTGTKGFSASDEDTSWLDAFEAQQMQLASRGSQRGPKMG